MRYHFTPMTIDYIKEITEWKYGGVVKGIYTDPYFESHKEGNRELRGPGGCYGYAVMDGDSLIGLFEYYLKDGCMEIGLALNPILTGKGLGKDFVLAGLEFGIKEFSYDEAYIRLTVDVNNHPAIRVYEKAGFVKVSEDNQAITMHWYL